MEDQPNGAYAAARVGSTMLCVLARVLVPAAVIAASLGGSAVAFSADRDAQGTLELLAGRAAGLIAGRPVTVRCESQSEAKSHSSSELGPVNGRYDGRTKRFVESAHLIELAPVACVALQRFAEADEKPTT